MARALAPVLYLQRDEWFQLARIVAVIHPNRRIIGYYLLWSDDVHGALIVEGVKPTLNLAKMMAARPPAEVSTYDVSSPDVVVVR